MRTEYIFPTALIALDLCAALVYAAKCEWRMALLQRNGFHIPLRHEQAGRMIGRIRERQGW